jgi:glycogen debranching enzyme
VDGVQLTWMDAKIGDEVVTPRIGKPVEVQALWLNALAFGSTISEEWRAAFERGRASFESKFWNDERQCLFDVIDVDHVKGRTDGALRPNQILAVGGLPVSLLTGDRARRVVDIVESTLLTPVGLRSLAPGEAGYTGRYAGGVSARDHAYHQGTVWPWLLGAFVEAWARVRGNTREAVNDAHQRLLAPLVDRIERSGSGHLAEIADADEPFDFKGCPFQAWSLGEVLRVAARNAVHTAESKSIRGDMVRRVDAHSSAPLS